MSGRQFTHVTESARSNVVIAEPLPPGSTLRYVISWPQSHPGDEHGQSSILRPRRWLVPHQPSRVQGSLSRVNYICRSCCLIEKCYRHSVAPSILIDPATKFEAGHRRRKD